MPASHLRLGLQCGGSDGYSGISANPVLGAAVDLLVQHGGTAILSETPEIYGAEHLLTRRAQTPDIGRKLIERIRWWEEYCARNGASMDNNPSSGNKAGGLTTVLEKSLGGIAKAGSTNLVEVYQYAEPVRAHGLVFMDTPGYDPVSATGRGRRQSDLLHHRPRLRLWLRAGASFKLATNTAPAPAGRRHGPELRRCAGRHARHRRTGRDPVRATACNRFRRAVAQRTPWIWTTGIRALANQRDHLIPSILPDWNPMSLSHPPRHRGLYPVVPTIFNDDGSLDLDGQRRCVQFMIDSGVDGLCVLANYSEQFLLADEEREILTRQILQCVDGRVPVIVTTSHFSSTVCVERAPRTWAPPW